jgi:glycosyltransferase involved in cell wall biosynthesis
MPVFFRVAQVLDWLIALSWMMRVLVWRHLLPQVTDLTRTDYPFQAQTLPSLTVIVPARNEAANIAATLRSLLAVEGVVLQIIAVDDRSTDQTGDIIETLAEIEAYPAGKALDILHVTELPAGWLGKTYAMAVAAQQASGDWLLFTDADVLFHRDALRRALEYATQSGADHMVLLPTILLRT